MKSVKLKIILLALASVIISSLFVGGVSIINSRRAVSNNAVQIMNLLCENRKDEINSLFTNIAQSVETLTVYAKHQIPNIETFIADPNFVNSYSQNLIDVALNAAENTDGAMSVYIRFNPEIMDSKAGFFYSKNDDSGNFKEIEPTDLSKYEQTDAEHVGWFYNAVNAKEGIWVDPYYNRNVGILMVSYSVPFYVDDTLVGVVGMDIDFDFLINVVANTTIYHSGSAFLTDNQARIVYHKELEKGTDLHGYNNNEYNDLAQAITSDNNAINKLIRYTDNGIDQKATYRELINGLQLVVTAPTSEINEQQDQLILQIVGAVGIVIVFMSIMGIIFAKQLVRPLTELTDAAKKIADGDLNVSITHQSKDEIGILAESFRQTIVHLEKSFTDINRLAYLDSLTGIKNKTAYFKLVHLLDQQIGKPNLEYAVIVFDINGLKLVNDTHGHDCGDQLIINASQIICDTFKRSPVCRIGGDEFVVLLQKNSYVCRESLLKKLEESIIEFNKNENHQLKVSIAWGMALYIRDIDISYNDVFKKADNIMYERKLKMKKEID